MLNFVLLPALFGFAYRRPAFVRPFWEVTVPLAWAALVFGVFSPTHRRQAREKGVPVAVATVLGSLALNLPGMWAINLYAYSQSSIWNRQRFGLVGRERSSGMEVIHKRRHGFPQYRKLLRQGSTQRPRLLAKLVEDY